MSLWQYSTPPNKTKRGVVIKQDDALNVMRFYVFVLFSLIFSFTTECMWHFGKDHEADYQYTWSPFCEEPSREGTPFQGLADTLLTLWERLFLIVLVLIQITQTLKTRKLMHFTCTEMMENIL